MKLVHLELDQANNYVYAVHRHHKPVRGHRFSVGACKGPFIVGAAIVGAAIVGRPVAQKTCYKTTVEVTRLATNGTKNACSFLYAAAARAAQALGYHKIQTFILESEPGTSLIAAGWVRLAESDGGSWNRPSRGGRREDQPQEPKVKWGKNLTPSLAPSR